MHHSLWISLTVRVTCNASILLGVMVEDLMLIGVQKHEILNIFGCTVNGARARYDLLMDVYLQQGQLQ